LEPKSFFGTGDENFFRIVAAGGGEQSEPHILDVSGQLEYILDMLLDK
jgi:hypothetical protein